MIAVSEVLLIDLLRGAGRGDETALRDLQQQTRHLLAHCIRRFVKDPWREEEVLQDVGVEKLDESAAFGSTLLRLSVFKQLRILETLVVHSGIGPVVGCSGQ